MQMQYQTRGTTGSDVDKDFRSGNFSVFFWKISRFFEISPSARDYPRFLDQDRQFWEIRKISMGGYRRWGVISRIWPTDRKKNAQRLCKCNTRPGGLPEVKWIRIPDPSHFRFWGFWRLLLVRVYIGLTKETLRKSLRNRPKSRDFCRFQLTKPVRNFEFRTDPGKIQLKRDQTNPETSRNTAGNVGEPPEDSRGYPYSSPQIPNVWHGLVY